MASIIEVLEKEHREAEGLFSQIEQTQEPTERANLFADLAEQFEAHASSEELAVYPKVHTMVAAEGITEHAYGEHVEARQLFAKVAALNPADDSWMEALRELKENVEHHVKEEETEMFPKMRKLFTEEQLKIMASEAEQAKQRLQQAS